MLRRAARGLALMLLAAFAFGSIYLGAQYASGNFQTVIDGELYRSGQLNAAQVTEYASRHGIRTIINLRGENAGKPWYDAEVAAADRLKINHVNYGISARRELSLSQARELVELMRDAPKPLLIHCEGGADRSGLASALYLAGVKNAGETEAGAQLSVRFGHFSLPFLAVYAMDRTFGAFQPLPAPATGQMDRSIVATE